MYTERHERQSLVAEHHGWLRPSPSAHVSLLPPLTRLLWLLAARACLPPHLSRARSLLPCAQAAVGWSPISLTSTAITLGYGEPAAFELRASLMPPTSTSDPTSSQARHLPPSPAISHMHDLP